MRIQIVYVTYNSVIKPEDYPIVSTYVDGIESVKWRFFQFMQPECRHI